LSAYVLAGAIRLIQVIMMPEPQNIES
jgi:hypothetical protein